MQMLMTVSSFQTYAWRSKEFPTFSVHRVHVGNEIFIQCELVIWVFTSMV